jgi:hypothetical protein
MSANNLWGLMTMQRLSLMFVVVAALAGCSSGSGTVASSAKPTSPTEASPTSSSSAPTSSPAPSKASGAGATNFCDAFKELESAKGVNDAAATGAAFRSAAADMRTYAPAEIKAAAGTYADVIDSVGKAAQSGSLDKAALQQELASGLAGKAQDLAAVAVWVGKNCHL